MLQFGCFPSAEFMTDAFLIKSMSDFLQMIENMSVIIKLTKVRDIQNSPHFHLFVKGSRTAC